VMAVPVGAQDAVQRIRDADEVICPRTSTDFGSVSACYRSFDQVSDDEVATLLGDVRASGR
jgi:predicted phosphoribosyltransferase